MDGRRVDRTAFDALNLSELAQALRNAIVEEGGTVDSVVCIGLAPGYTSATIEFRIGSFRAVRGCRFMGADPTSSAKDWTRECVWQAIEAARL